MPKIQLYESTKSVKKESRMLQTKENKRKIDEDSENR